MHGRMLASLYLDLDLEAQREGWPYSADVGAQGGWGRQVEERHF